MEVIGLCRGNSFFEPGKTQGKQVEKDNFSGLLKRLTAQNVVPETDGELSAPDIQSLQKVRMFLNKEEAPDDGVFLEMIDSLLALGFDIAAFLRGDSVAVPNNVEQAFLDFSSRGQNGWESLQYINIQTVIAALETILSLPEEQLSSSLNQEVLAMIKAAKLFEWAENQQFSPIKEGQVAGILNQLAEKITALLNRENEQLDSKQENQLLRFLSGLKMSAKPIQELNNGKEAGTGERLNVSLSQPKTNGNLSAAHFHWSKPDQISISINTTDSEPASTQFTKQIEQLLVKSRFTNINGTQRLNIKLVPEHLGRLHIELIHRNGEMTARILTATGLAKEMLESRLHLLKQVFNQQNISLEKLEIVEQLHEPQEKYFHREHHSNEQPNEDQRRHTRRDKKEKEQEFAADFEEFILSLQA